MIEVAKMSSPILWRVDLIGVPWGTTSFVDKGDIHVVFIFSRAFVGIVLPMSVEVQVYRTRRMMKPTFFEGKGGEKRERALEVVRLRFAFLGSIRASFSPFVLS